VQATADQLRFLTDAAPIGIFQTDTRNRYVYTNPRWSEITGIAPEEAAGREWHTIVGSEARAGLVAELHGGELCHRFELRVPGSAPRIALVTSRSIPDGDGRIAGWVGTLADVTAEAGAEAAMSEARDRATEASQLKSDFLANMSHEIRTPMNGVIGMTELLLETDLDPRQREYAQTVRTSGEAMLALMNDILDFSKVEAGKLEIENIEFNVQATIDDVVDLLAARAHVKGLGMEADVDSSVPAVVRGDPGRVRQVLINLIGNAIKFTQQGAVVVRVRQAEAVGGDPVVRFEVSDTGEGIAPDKLATVFRPFVQADSSTSRKHGGTGLGLAISSQLVALMGGACGVSSRLGEGSDFWFTIRVQAVDGQIVDDARASPPTTGADPAEEPAAVAHLDTGHILLAEDNSVNQRVATAMLEHLGFRVDVVSDGSDAVEAATRTSYQAILMDCQMPVLDGYEATGRIRLLEGADRRTPIIAVTASAMKSDQQRCLAAGMDDYVPKPLSLKALSEVLARWGPDGSGHIAASDPVEPISAALVGLDHLSDPARPVLDAQVVDRLERLGVSAGEDLWGQLTALFLFDSEAHVLALRGALADDDAVAVARSAHTLRGAAANIGAAALARLCATLAMDGAAGDLRSSEALLQAIEGELERVCVALRSPAPTP
jgi:PAS domain S-box-containing protein